MLKLKIGDNFLITTKQDRSMPTFIKFCMGCIPSLHNKVLLGYEPPSLQMRDRECVDYIKSLKADNPREVYILCDIPSKIVTPAQTLIRNDIRHFMLEAMAALPTTKFSIIKMNSKLDSREFKLADQIYNALCADNKNILNHLDKLDEYKHFQTRYKAIPSELKVINENIKKMSKEVKVCDRTITLRDLEYLNMIEKAQLEGDSLIVDIKPLPIYPSEPLGKVFTKGSFESNPYLVRAAKYIYQGCHFGMVGTRVRIRPDFRPEFIETHDHQWDDLFKFNNWSSIGYLHFGQGHLCGGEFNDVMAHTGEHGLEYYFMCFKQYITTANIRDIAGKKVWWYPIYNDNNELVYCAGLDVLRDRILRMDIPQQDKEDVKKMSIAEFQEWRLKHKIRFTEFSLEYRSDSPMTHSSRDDMFLQYLSEREPEFLKELEKGANNNG